MITLVRRNAAKSDVDGRRLAARIFAELGMDGALVVPRFDAELGAAIAARHGEAISSARRLGLRHCRVCGCTEDHACIEEDGFGCSWREADLCSVCARFPEPAA